MATENQEIVDEQTSETAQALQEGDNKFTRPQDPAGRWWYAQKRRKKRKEAE